MSACERRPAHHLHRTSVLYWHWLLTSTWQLSQSVSVSLNNKLPLTMILNLSLLLTKQEPPSPYYGSPSFCFPLAKQKPPSPYNISPSLQAGVFSFPPKSRSSQGAPHLMRPPEGKTLPLRRFRPPLREHSFPSMCTTSPSK